MKIRNLIKYLIGRTIFAKNLSKAEEKKFREEFEIFSKLAADLPKRFDINWFDRKPVTNDATEKHSFDRHYIYHTGWAARKIKSISPDYHVDISSSLYFNSIASAFIPIRFYDFRPANIKLNGLTCEKADITKLQFEDESIKSISCMHVIEHIGLGRYGDPINPNADLDAFSQLNRVLSPDGSLLLVVPIGKPRLQFNAQRIYSYEQIIDIFKNLQLMEFSLVPDFEQEGLIINATKNQADSQYFGCGCFWFKKNGGS